MRRILLPILLLAFALATGRALAASPVISGVSPVRGAPGTTVSITGQNFLGLQEVWIGNIRATVTGFNSSQIVIIVPANALSGPVSVFTTGGQSSTTGNFQVAPRIEIFYRELDQFGEPKLPALAVPGDTILVRGANFDDPNHANPANGLGVFINSLRAGGQIIAPNLLQITVPNGARTGPLTITNFAGTFTTTQLLYFQPLITNFTARAKIGDTVELLGVNLTGTTQVQFGALPAASFTVVGGTNIQAVVPAGAANGKISITTPGGAYVTTTDFLVLPHILGFTPGGGGAGTVVTITGTALNNTTAVRFGEAAGTALTLVSATQVQATVPNSATTGPITLVTTSGTNISTATFFAAPKLTQLLPSQGQAGTVVKVTGQNFTGTTEVRLGTTVVPQFTVDSPTQITFTVPEGAVTGFVQVTTPGGSVDSQNVFTVQGNGPVITGLMPEFGPVGTQVALTGSNFGSVTNVSFNGVAAVFTVVNATSIQTTVPAGATTGPVTVRSAAGVGTSPRNFIIGTTTDLRTTMTPTVTPPVAHGPLGFSLRVVNQGILPAQSASLAVTLPDGVSFVDATGTRPFTLNGKVITYNLGNMNPEDVMTGVVRVMVGPPAELAFSAAATSAIADATPANNTVNLNLVAAAPKLRIEPLNAGILVLSWPAAGSNYVAQRRGSLGTGTWETIAGSPANDGDTLQLQVPLEGTGQFYQVQRP